MNDDPKLVGQQAATTSSGRVLLGRQGRRIGPLGTIARAAVGLALVGSVVSGHARTGVEVGAWFIGLGVLPALTIAAQRWRAGRRSARLVWLTGPLGHVVTFAAFMTLYLTWWYAPAISVLSDAALIFYGTAMLLAAARGYAGCEVLAISNWVLRRDDQVGCLLFEPIDSVERRVNGGEAAATRR